MKTRIRKSIKRQVNSLFGHFDLKLTRPSEEFGNYIKFKETIRNAQLAGEPVGDFIDHSFNVSGATQLTMDKMSEIGVFRNGIHRVCEIGPGSGRYLEKTIEVCHPDYYEIYETAKEWRNWLKVRYGVIAHDADGKTLSHTETNSIDLIQAHKVFPGLQVLIVLGYFSEMIRVCHPGGYIVFDVLTEDCFTSDLMPKWIESRVNWPCAVIPDKLVVNFFINSGAEFLGDFNIPMMPGITHYFVFHKAK